jgi:hypothetical protein
MKRIALASVSAFTFAACGSEAGSTGAAPVATDAPNSTAGVPANGAVFAVNPKMCENSNAATTPIDGPLKIGTSAPLSGGPAVLFAAFVDGQRAYIGWHNDETGRDRRSAHRTHDQRRRTPRLFGQDRCRHSDLRRRGRPARWRRRYAERLSDS